MSYDKELNFAKDLALEAGQIMRKYFKSEDIDTTWKEDDTPLTIADTTINSLVIERIKEAFPDDGVVGEEEDYEPKRERVWVVDPIDGTVPFSLDMPVSTFLMALVERHDGQPVVSVIYDPYLDHLYTAVKGQGAYMNGKRLQTSKRTEFRQNYVTVHGGAISGPDFGYQPGRVLDNLREKGARNLAFASGAYTAVKIAEGRYACVLAGKPGWPWDFAAPCLLVQEAGGVVTDISGKARRYDEPGFGCILAANQSLLEQILAIIKETS